MGISTKYLCHRDYYGDLDNFYVMEITVRISVKKFMEITMGISTKEFMSWRLLWGSQPKKLVMEITIGISIKYFFSHIDYGGDLN